MTFSLTTSIPAETRRPEAIIGRQTCQRLKTAGTDDNQLIVAVKFAKGIDGCQHHSYGGGLGKHYRQGVQIVTEDQGKLIWCLRISSKRLMKSAIT